MCDRVAIIEKGQLLAVGTVDEILHGGGRLAEHQIQSELVNQKQVVISISLKGEPKDVATFLRDEFQIVDVSFNENTIDFSYSKDPDLHADLLTSLVQRGFRVTQFRVKQRSLEDAFLHVTKGLVQ